VKSVDLTLLSFTSPGETWRTDTNHTINWSTENISKSRHVKIEYSLDDGENWAVIDESAVNDGSKKWDLSDRTYNICKDTSKAKIKITCVEDTNATVTSDRFKIDHKKGHPDC